MFSIAIPTRNREDLARMSAQYVLAQDFTDFEVILLDNSDRQELSTEEFGDERCKVVPALAVLSMRDNWERALEVGTGQYVMVLSDKDALVQGALRRLAKVIAATSPAMLSYRKAAHGNSENVRSFVQRCSGRTTELRGDAVLRAWFEEVRHFHDAPMIYNSVVRREVLIKLKSVSGRFFAGTSPDIGSGAVLLASLGNYHLLDRPLVVSRYGAWSIGMAAMRGPQGANAACLAEYGRDPMRDAGLVTGIPGSVAETLLECKRIFPALFSSYRVKWPGYVKSALLDLNRREQLGVDTRQERAFLRTARERPYTWFAWAIGKAAHSWERAEWPLKFGRKVSRIRDRVFRGRERRAPMAPNATSSLESEVRLPARTLARYFDVPCPGIPSFRSVPCVMMPLTLGFQQLLSITDEINVHLDREVTTAAGVPFALPLDHALA